MSTGSFNVIRMSVEELDNRNNPMDIRTRLLDASLNLEIICSPFKKYPQLHLQAVKKFWFVYSIAVVSNFSR